MNIIVSACLLGLKCRYDGAEKPCEKVIKLKQKYNLIPVCPEILGGLPTPRDASEILGGRVLTKLGADNTEAFTKGAYEVLYLCKLLDCKKAILKAKSPSCGCGEVYDGTFSNKLIKGDGITAKLLLENGIEIFNENTIEGENDEKATAHC